MSENVTVQRNILYYCQVIHMNKQTNNPKSVTMEIILLAEIADPETGWKYKLFSYLLRLELLKGNFLHLRT